MLDDAKLALRCVVVTRSALAPQLDELKLFADTYFVGCRFCGAEFALARKPEN